MSTLQSDLGDLEQQARDLRARQSALDKLRNGTSQDGKSLSENGTRKRMRFGEEEGNDTNKKVKRPCRDFASGECKFGTSCRFSHDESAQQRPYEERWKSESYEERWKGESNRHDDARSGKSGKGKSKGKGGKGDRGEDSRSGSSAHRTLHPKPGTFQFGPNSRVFAYLESERCLVEQFGWRKEDARQMCFEVGADDSPGESRCPYPMKESHRGPRAWAHDFPRDYSATLRRVHPRI